MRVPLKTATPLRCSVTRQRRPTRFWSTSNSVSMRPSSAFAFSFQVVPAVQRPETRTPSPSYAGAAKAVGAKETSAAATAATAA